MIVLIISHLFIKYLDLNFVTHRYPQNQISMLPKSLNHFNSSQSVQPNDHDNQSQFLLKSVNNNTNAAPYFRTQTDVLMSTQMNFEKVRVLSSNLCDYHVSLFSLWTIFNTSKSMLQSSQWNFHRYHHHHNRQWILNVWSYQIPIWNPSSWYNPICTRNPSLARVTNWNSVTPLDQ